MYDVTIIGAGMAGLQLARLVARGGGSVLLVDARRSVTQAVRTTGIFVRRTIEDFPSLHPFLGAPIRTLLAFGAWRRKVIVPLTLTSGERAAVTTLASTPGPRPPRAGAAADEVGAVEG